MLHGKISEVMDLLSGESMAFCSFGMYKSTQLVMSSTLDGVAPFVADPYDSTPILCTVGWCAKSAEEEENPVA